MTLNELKTLAKIIDFDVNSDNGITSIILNDNVCCEISETTPYMITFNNDNLGKLSERDRAAVVELSYDYVFTPLNER